MTTLTEKKHLFDTIQKLASSELPITQRLNTIKEFVEQESFQHKMLNYCAHLSMFNFRKSDWGTIFSHIFMYFKQRILLALAKIGLYQPTSQSCLQMLRDAVKSSPSASPDINQYSLFQSLKKPVLNVISYEVASVH
jgi:hypothetical protein